MLKAKFFDVNVAELQRGTTLAEHLDQLVNGFLAERGHVEIVHSHMNSVVMPPEDGGGQYLESPACVVVILALYYRE